MIATESLYENTFVNLVSILQNKPSTLPASIFPIHAELQIIGQLLRDGRGAVALNLTRRNFTNAAMGLLYVACTTLEADNKPHDIESVAGVVEGWRLDCAGLKEDRSRDVKIKSRLELIDGGLIVGSKYIHRETVGDFEGFEYDGKDNSLPDMRLLLNELAQEPPFDGFDTIESIAKDLHDRKNGSKLLHNPFRPNGINNLAGLCNTLSSEIPIKNSGKPEVKNVWKVNTVLASNIQPEEVEWLWENRIPRDSLSVFSGDADKGKGVTATDIIARLTTGRGMPLFAPNPFGGPISVLVMGAEDALNTVVVPRLIAAGADLTKVHILQSVSREGEKSVVKRQLSLDKDLHLISAMLREFPDIKLVLIDPISNYVGDVDINREVEVRKALTPVRDLAEEMKLTFIVIAHFNKNAGASAIHRVGGAQALTSLPRSSWCFMNDPEVEGQYLMLSIKKNVGKKAKGMMFRIEETFIDIGKAKLSSQPKIVWGGETDRGANEIMGEENDPEQRGLGKAKKWLSDYLADGERVSTEVYRASEKIGISERTLKRAMKQLDVDSFRDGFGQGSIWHMRLKRPGGSKNEPRGKNPDPKFDF